jgi:hypothetical protein
VIFTGLRLCFIFNVLKFIFYILCYMCYDCQKPHPNRIFGLLGTSFNDGIVIKGGMLLSKLEGILDRRFRSISSFEVTDVLVVVSVHVSSEYTFSLLSDIDLDVDVDEDEGVDVHEDEEGW